MRTGIANKGKASITSLRSDTSLRRTHVLTLPHLSGCVFQPLSICLTHARPFLHSSCNGNGGHERSYTCRLFQSYCRPPFACIGLTALRERIGVAPDYETCKDERQKDRSHPLLRWPRQTNHDLLAFLLASASTALGWTSR